MENEELLEPHETPVERKSVVPRKYSSKKFLLLLLVGLLFLIVGLVIYEFVSSSEEDENSFSSALPNGSEDVVTGEEVADVPFKEMTIPYLATQEYSSQLSELERLGDNGSYTSYLTSYDSDGLNINGLLTVPTGDEPEGGWPGIVFIHGYIPPSVYQTNSESYSDYVNYLARNGFVVFKIDLRGHGSSEGEASGAYYSGDYVVDALNARAALASSDFVNPDRIGLWGHSMAGNIVMRSVAVARDIPAAAIWAGAVYTYEDWQKYGLNDNSYRPPSDMSERQRRRQELLDAHGEFDAASEFWRTVVPTNYLDDVTTAIQFNHAVNDDVVNIGYSRDVMPTLEEAGVTVELNEYPSGGHNISGPAFSQAMQNTLRFYQENL